jgi:hypothetical protein
MAPLHALTCSISETRPGGDSGRAIPSARREWGSVLTEPSGSVLCRGRARVGSNAAGACRSTSRTRLDVTISLEDALMFCVWSPPGG